jgi:hypothetical protein
MKIKIANLRLNNEKNEFFFERYTGISLIRPSNSNEEKTTLYGAKLSLFLKLNTHPYTLALIKTSTIEKNRAKSLLKIYGIILTRLFSINFYLGYMFSKISVRVFCSSKEAICFYRKYVYPNQQSDLCLARAFFASAASKKFKQDGVIFIGLFLPSKSMHAWVIEDGAVADTHDGIWLNYQPLAAIYYE